MKLQTKINRRFITLLLLVFLVAGCGLYFTLAAVIDSNIDEILSNRAETVRSSLHQNKIVFPFHSPDQTIDIQLSNGQSGERQFSDTAIYAASETSMVPARKLVFQERINGKTYKVTLLLSHLEAGDFVGLAFWFMLGTFVLIILALYFLNRKLSATIWNPFYRTLKELKEFKVDQKTVKGLTSSSIDEFDQMNNVLNQMMRKMTTDYANLKEFSENASHEMQTPLAVVKSKLETLLTDRNLSEEHRKQVQTAYDAASRVSKLGQTLLLLSKIENNQFIEKRPIDLSALVAERMDELIELLALRNIEVVCNLQQSFSVNMNPMLADLLVTNLLGNAIKHNVDNGFIHVTSQASRLSFRNTGKMLQGDPQSLFSRFAKEGVTKDSNGLGLSIVAEICKVSSLAIDYTCPEGVHCLTLSLL
jgi:signal transduction histidine kinase